MAPGDGLDGSKRALFSELFGTKHFDFFMLGGTPSRAFQEAVGMVFGGGVTLQRSQKHQSRALPGLRSSNNIIILQ